MANGDNLRNLMPGFIGNAVDEDEIIRALWALGQRTRWRIMAVLLASDSLPLPVNTIAEEADVLQNSASTHLAILQRVGLVASTRNGRQVLYSPQSDRLTEVQQAIAALACARGS